MWTLNNYSLLAFLGCAVIGLNQGDEHSLMSKFSYCGHIRSCKERCVSNKYFYWVQSICFTLHRCYLGQHAIRACSHSAIFSDCDCDLIFAYNGLHSKSHSVNTSIDSCTTHQRNRSRNQKKTHSVNGPLIGKAIVMSHLLEKFLKLMLFTFSIKNCISGHDKTSQLPLLTLGSVHSIPTRKVTFAKISATHKFISTIL